MKGFVPVRRIVGGRLFLLSVLVLALMFMTRNFLTAESEPRSGAVRFEGAEVMRAYGAAYPDRIQRVAFRSGRWAAEIDGVWFYWAGGKLLNEKLLPRESEYDPYPFYPYSRGLPPLPAPEQAAAVLARVGQREANPPQRHPGFFNALWRIDDRDSSWSRMKTAFFLGHRLEIHRDLLEDLAAVEEEIQRLLPTDGELRRFVANLQGIDAYNWRPIAGTASLSFHSYGTALDIRPASYGGKAVYWRWALTYRLDWFMLPHERRYRPPESFVQAFEKQGFIWGGKWFYFDTIHFEYRPEILLLNGLHSAAGESL